MTNAIFVEQSNNKKIRGYKNAKVCTTYASVKASCPRSCALHKTQECYALHGHVGLVVNRLDKGMDARQAYNVACQEAEAIDLSFRGGPIPQDGAKGGRDMRLHTAGDCKTNQTAKVLAGAVRRWLARGGGKVWTYTHAWKKVHRESWGDVSVLASVDDKKEAIIAINAGYAPARYVGEFPRGKKSWKESGVLWIPCRAQTEDEVGCTDCRLCMNVDKLHRHRMGIAFEAHGCKGRKMKERLAK